VEAPSFLLFLETVDRDCLELVPDRLRIEDPAAHPRYLPHELVASQQAVYIEDVIEEGVDEVTDRLLNLYHIVVLKLWREAALAGLVLVH
jgi:hypothetical protein